MKKLLTVFLSLTLLTGCAFLRESTTAQKAADVQRLATIAASVGTQTALQLKPEHRPQFETALASLNVVVENKTINGVMLRQILATLPVKELESPEAKIAVMHATMLFDLFVGDQLNIEMQPYVFAAATGVRNGMRDALAVTSPSFK